MNFSIDICISPRRLLLVLSVYLLCLGASAQTIKIVSGQVVDKETKKPFKDEAAEVFAFNTVADAEDALLALSESGNIFPDATTKTDRSGNYEIRVAETGALIFRVSMSEPILEKVNRRMKINVTIDAGILLGNINVVGALQDISPLPEPPTIVGNQLAMYNNFPIPARFGRSNARLIIQPYVLECGTNDTIAFTTPLVFDGEQYRTTQERRMGYNLENDVLTKYVSPRPLTSERMTIPWADTLQVPDPKKNYTAFAVFQLEDYNEIYYSKTSKITGCNARRPLKFLEYQLTPYHLDPQRYRRTPKRELRNTSTNISLTFLVNKAALDPNDPNNDVQLERLKSGFLDIVNSEDCKLKEIEVTGVSSPDGNYDANMRLARQRAAYALDKIRNELPASSLRHTFMPAPDAMVAPWQSLCEALEKDSLYEESHAIADILAKYPDNVALQMRQIRKLKYYDTLIREKLKTLRYMRVSYKYEVFRELTPDEILYRYNNDQDYRTGKKEFALYEYWHLFQLVKDPKQLEDLYTRAYHYSAQTEGSPWALPANLLAISYLKRDTIDTQLLEPFINRKIRKVNVVQPNGNIVNPEAIVANQLIMYLRADNFEQASIMAQILPDTPENKEIKAFAMCLGGYYRGGNTPDERYVRHEVFNLVKSSSPLNEVVMLLAMNMPRYNNMASEAVRQLPANDPRAWYLKAVIHHREGESSLDMAKYCLMKCFTLDEGLIPTAEMDGDIGEELFEYTMDSYELEKGMIDSYIKSYEL